MKRVALGTLTVEELVLRYVAVGVAQDEAERKNENAKFRRLFHKLIEIEAELKARPGDQRRVLTALYGHENRQVRLNAAHATLALEPIKARQALEALRDSRWFPQAMDAGMSLRNLDSGVYKPT